MTRTVPDRFADARRLVHDGVEARAYPAAVIEVGRTAAPVWSEAFGRLTYEPDAPVCELDTIFDLASLTKVLATTTLATKHVAEGHLTLDTPVGALIAAWHGGDRDAVTIRHLLDHSSGLPAHVRFWERGFSGSEQVEAAICELPLEYAPGRAAVYSDPGFILLGFALERVARARLDAQYAALPPGGSLVFLPPAGLRSRIAPTEHDPWRGRLLQGEVHDENAALLGGVAGHAGLFGTASAVGAFARDVLRTLQEETWLGSPSLMSEFASASRVPGSSRALGWDTMRPTSSCGTRMSSRAIGHTGFTGTSVWIDPARDVYVVFLTNRVHPTRSNTAQAAIRPRVHDAVMASID